MFDWFSCISIYMYFYQGKTTIFILEYYVSWIDLTFKYFRSSPILTQSVFHTPEGNWTIPLCIHVTQFYIKTKTMAWILIIKRNHACNGGLHEYWTKMETSTTSLVLLMLAGLTVAIDIQFKYCSMYFFVLFIYLNYIMN